MTVNLKANFGQICAVKNQKNKKNSKCLTFLYLVAGILLAEAIFKPFELFCFS
jgi:hypothetical protein